MKARTKFKLWRGLSLAKAKSLGHNMSRGNLSESHESIVIAGNWICLKCAAELNIHTGYVTQEEGCTGSAINKECTNG